MSSALESLGRIRLQAILVLIAVFAVGLLAGAALDRAWWQRPHPPGQGGPPPGGHGPGPKGLPPELGEKLGLTADQDRRIQEIFAGSRPRADAVLDRFLPELRAVADSVRTEIRNVLTPRQREIFDREQPPILGDRRPPARGPGPGGYDPGRPGSGGPPPGPGDRPPEMGGLPPLGPPPGNQAPAGDSLHRGPRPR